MTNQEDCYYHNLLRSKSSFEQFGAFQYIGTCICGIKMNKKEELGIKITCPEKIIREDGSTNYLTGRSSDINLTKMPIFKIESNYFMYSHSNIKEQRASGTEVSIDLNYDDLINLRYELSRVIEKWDNYIRMEEL